MRAQDAPTEEQLKELYEAAAAFKQLKPWQWLYDTDIICIENPETEEMGYCSVMGAGGDFYALGVYLGTVGLNSLWQMLLPEYDNLNDNDLFYCQDCIMCSYEDRDNLNSKDLKQIKSLGLKFRGRGAWPMFRRYEPGYFPWFINKEESIFLTHALRQVAYVAESLKDGSLEMDTENGISIVRSYKKENGIGEWHSEKLQLDIPVFSYSPAIIKDELLVQKIKNAPKMNHSILQADISYINAIIHENKKERPFYPRAFLLGDLTTGLILNFNTYQHQDDDTGEVLNILVEHFLKNGTPKEIQVKREKVFAILMDLCEKTGISLELVNRLPVIDEALEDFESRF